MPRDAQGKFVLKNDEHRSVRSLRLTDTTWTALGVIAESLSLTRADLLEQMFNSNDHPPPSNTRIIQQPLPRNTWKQEADQPSNTHEEEIRRLRAEVAHLRSENAELEERLRELPLVSDLEVIRERVLKSLKLGKQAPGYRTAKSALNQFIELLRSHV
jgi:vacuolar-type H+-ATPase subunit I/STV1